MDRRLVELLLQCKMSGDGEGTRYIWHTQEDDKVRASHAENDGKIFNTDDPPSTGNPGEDYNCRCWAQPLDADSYAEQILVTPINDNPVPWTTVDFTQHYLTGDGEGVTLLQTGHLRNAIDHYANHAIAKDGLPGVYRRVNQQVIEKALEEGAGGFIYTFSNHYNFKPVVVALGESVVSGIFVGDARREREYLVISGFITYIFTDAYTDPASLVETLVVIFGIGRREAEGRAEDISDVLGKPYPITDRWQTKFNATVKLR